MGGGLRLLPQMGPTNSCCWSQTQLFLAAFHYFHDSEFGKTPRYSADEECVVMETSRNVCEIRLSPVRLLYADLASVWGLTMTTVTSCSAEEHEKKHRSDGQILEPLVPLFIPLVQFSSVTAEQGLRRPERCLWGFFLFSNLLVFSDKISISERRGDRIRHLERKHVSCHIVLGLHPKSI